MLQIGTRESEADVARTLSRYVDCIIYRTFEHSKVEEMAKYAMVPVINALSDKAHPCQALADVYTIREKFKILNPKYETIKIVFVGDGNNVARSLNELCKKTGIKFLNTRNVPARQIQIANRLMFTTAQDSFAVDIDMSDDGRLLPMYGSNGYIRFPSDLSILDEAFERARLAGKFKTSADVEAWLNERLPNWLYLLKQQHSDPKRDNGRAVFRRSLPYIFRTRTIQDYVGRIDRGEIIPFNLAAIYFNDPSVLRIENGKVVGFTIPPDRYFAAKGMRNYTTPEEQRRQAEQRRVINDFVTKNLSAGDEPLYSYWAAYLKDPNDVKWADAEHQALLKRIQIRACDNALALTAKNLAAADQNLAAIDRNIAGLQGSMTDVRTMLLSVSQMMAGAGLNIVRERRQGSNGSTYNEVVVTMGASREEIFRGGRAAKAREEEVFLIYRNVLVPIFRALEAAGLTKGVSLVCADAKTYEEFVKLGGLAHGSSTGAFSRDAGVIMDLLSKHFSSSYGGTWPVNSINANAIAGQEISRAQAAAQVLSGVPLELPMAQVSVKPIEGRVALLIDGKEMNPSDPSFNRNAALLYERFLKPFIEERIQEGKLKGPVPGSFLQAADMILTGLDIPEMTFQPMPVDCGVLCDVPIAQAKVNIERVVNPDGSRTVNWWVRTANGMRILNPSVAADKAVIDSLHQNVVAVLMQTLGAGAKTSDPSRDAGVLMNRIAQIDGFGACNSLNFETLRKAAEAMHILRSNFAHACKTLTERQLETMRTERQKMAGQREGVLSDRSNIQSLRAQFERM